MRFNIACPTLSIFILGLISHAALASDSTLEEWQRVKGVSGCAGIPYSELARKCMDTMVDVAESCKQVKWNCDDVPSLKGNEEEASNRRKKAEDLESKLSSITDDSERKKTEAEIKEQREKATEAEERAKGAEKELELRKRFGNECLKLRETVQEHFQKTMERADHESSGFSPEIKLIYADKKAEWEREYEAHKDPIEKVKEGIDKCERKLNRN